MLEMAFLLVFLLIALIISYLVSNRDILAPDVLFIAGFVLAVIAALMNVKEWAINLSVTTIMIIIATAMVDARPKLLYLNAVSMV